MYVIYVEPIDLRWLVGSEFFEPIKPPADAKLDIVQNSKFFATVHQRQCPCNPTAVQLHCDYKSLIPAYTSKYENR
jgi:hypothetical protein